MYSPRKPKPETQEAVLFRDPFQEDRRNQNQMTLPIRRRQTGSPSSTMESPTSLPIRGPPMSGRSSAVDTSNLGRNAQTHFGDLQETRNHNELDQQSPTQSNQIDRFDGTRDNNKVEILMNGLNELQLKVLTSHAEYPIPTLVINSSRRGAIDFRGVPSVEQLSTALASDLELKPSLQEISESLFYHDVMPEVSIPGSNELEKPEHEHRELTHQDQQLIDEGHQPDERKEE